MEAVTQPDEVSSRLAHHHSPHNLYASQIQKKLKSHDLIPRVFGLSLMATRRI